MQTASGSYATEQKRCISWRRYTPQQHWAPIFDSKDLDARLENAFRRVAGSIGFALDRDRCNTMTLKNTAADAMDAGLEGGPLFMRLGRGLMELGSYTPGAHLSLQDTVNAALKTLTQ